MVKLAHKNFMALFITIIFSYPAAAVIIEGNFGGQMWEWQSTNMQEHPDADFFSDENAFRGFTGTFWYDTELAGSPVLNGNMWEFAGESAVYAGPHNWLHTTLTAANGATLNLTQRSSLPTFTENPKETISVARYENDDLISLSYDDGDWLSNAHRVGTITFQPQNSFLNNLSLIQNYSSSSVPSDNNVLGYIYFQDSGTLNGIDYVGWMVGEVNHFDIHVKESTTVPEPSSLFLFLGPLLLILWRANVLPRRIF
ncbi:MAG: hypothetical protein EOO53_13690 [Gammaproteobacteria bacterium]|nr:MAG: hypothetical protein EOO53_13690 [Gammaproteobacteria bacterium]